MRLIGRKSHLLTGTIVAGLVFSAGAVVPQQRRAARVRHFTEALRADVESTRARLEHATEVYTTANQESARGVKFDEAVPVGDRVGDFLQTVSVLADELGLRDKDVILAPEIELNEVIGLPIEISFKGEFEAVHAFLARIESLPRLARVQRLELAMSQETPGLLISSMTVLVYYRNS